MKYRVIMIVSYYEMWYEFDNAEDAVNFAVECLEHEVDSKDTKRKGSVSIKVINPVIIPEEEED